MDDTTRTASINRTIAVVIRYAVDLDHAVEVLLAEFGFDRTFLALASIEDGDTAVHRALWLALVAGADVAAADRPE